MRENHVKRKLARGETVVASSSFLLDGSRSERTEH